MNAKEAIEIIRLADDHGACNRPMSILEAGEQYFHAKGYLEALEGPEVKSLVEALKQAHRCLDSRCYVNVALAQFQEAVKKP